MTAPNATIARGEMMATQSDRHSKLVRLIILSDGDQDVDSLATQLSISVKTIRRDIAAIRKVGLPIEERTSEHGRKTYWLRRDAIPQIKFNYDEAFALMICQHAAEPFVGTSLGEAAANAFEKIRVAFGPVEKRYLDQMLPRVHRSFVGGDYTDHSEVLDAVSIGIEESRATFIVYHSARSTEPVTYDIHPYALAEHRGTLYVVGFSCHHNEIRTWKIDRMLEAEATQVPFSRPKEFDVKQHLRGAFAIVSGNTPVAVTVRFTGSAARYVQEKRMHPSQKIGAHSGATVDVTFDLTSTLEIKSWILSFGSSAEVLSPESLRDEIKQELQSASSLYAESRTPLMEPK